MIDPVTVIRRDRCNDIASCDIVQQDHALAAMLAHGGKFVRDIRDTQPNLIAAKALFR